MKIIFLIIMTAVSSLSYSQTEFSRANKKESRKFTDTIFSNSFGENRLLTVYLPAGFKNSRTYPVVYTADGQLLTDSYKKAIDSLISIKAIPKIVVIGVHSDETFIPEMGLEYRNFEYIKNLHGGQNTLNERFNKHFAFFTSEVTKYAEKKYSVSMNPNQKVFYGISNGADFGVTLAQEKPQFIRKYILCSIVAGSKEPFTWTNSDCPSFFFSCGNLEDESIQEESKRLDNYLSGQSIDHEFEMFNGGHERKKWEAQFIKTLPNVLSR